MSQRRRGESEQRASAALISQHVLREISHGTPPSMSSVADKFDVTRQTITRWLNSYRETCDEPSKETLSNWLGSHTNTPEVQQNYALLVRDILSSPETWGVSSMEDLSTALHMPIDNLTYTYKKFWQPDWPELPSRRTGWIGKEAAKAAEQGDVTKIKKLNAEHDELVAMRHDLIQQRLDTFVRL